MTDSRDDLKSEDLLPRWSDVVRATIPLRSGKPMKARCKDDGLVGRPKVRLPMSQLVLGRTSTPWNGRAWNTRQNAAVVDDALRVTFDPAAGKLNGSSFKSVPPCLPATDVTLQYRVRFDEHFPWGRGGRLPGLVLGCGAGAVAVEWLRSGCAAARVLHEGRTVFDDAQLHFERRGAWNQVILRVKLNGFDQDDTTPDGSLALSVNGRAVTLGGLCWRRRPAVCVDHVCMATAFWRAPPHVTHAEFAGFFIIR